MQQGPGLRPAARHPPWREEPELTPPPPFLSPAGDPSGGVDITQMCSLLEPWHKGTSKLTCTAGPKCVFFTLNGWLLICVSDGKAKYFCLMTGGYPF